MDYLAKQRTWAARTGLYMMMIKAKLCVALTAPYDPTASDGLNLHVAGQMGSRTVAAIFTDVAGMDRYEPRGLDFTMLDGMALFPLLQDAQVGSVLLNPGNAPRGEF